jgi:Flp pilus assembly protein TadG
MTYTGTLPPRPRARGRHGAASVELAFILPVVLVLILGTIDFAIIMYAYGTVSESARSGARYAIVHGSMAASPVGPGANDTTVANIVKANTPALDPANLTIASTWGSGSNTAGSPVSVNVSYNCPTFMLKVLGFNTIKVTGTTTMTIAH